ncbi:hypothetical protein [Roseomonas sp. WA12]
MTMHAHIMPDALPRRVLADLAQGPRRRQLPFAALVMTPELRAAIEREAHSLLDAATFLIDFLNAADRPTLDMEPDAEGEAEPDEASAQPVTLAPDWVRPVQVIRPTRRQMRQAYRRNGDPIPANLCGLFGRAFA